MIKDVELDLKRLMKGQETSFGCTIIGATGGHEERTCTSHGQNVAAARLEENGSKDAESIKVRKQIDLDGEFGFFWVKLKDAWARVCDASVVDKNADGAEILLNGFGGFEDAVVVGDIRLVEANSVGEDSGFGFGNVEDCNLDTFCSEALCDLDTDTTRATGDDCDLASRVGPGFASCDALATLEILAHGIEGEEGKSCGSGFGGGEPSVVAIDTLGERAEGEIAHCVGELYRAICKGLEDEGSLCGYWVMCLVAD